MGTRASAMRDTAIRQKLEDMGCNNYGNIFTKSSSLRLHLFNFMKDIFKHILPSILNF